MFSDLASSKVRRKRLPTSPFASPENGRKKQKVQEAGCPPRGGGSRAAPRNMSKQEPHVTYKEALGSPLHGIVHTMLKKIR